MIRLIFLLFVIILTGCSQKNNHIVVSPIDTTEKILSKAGLPIKYRLENCFCEEFPELNDYISCDTTIFTNGAKIYRRFTCDSSWLVFENNNIKKNIYSLEKELIELTRKLGYVGWDEYKESILIADRLWSGSGSPYEYCLLDKESGKEIINLGQEIYLNKEHSDPYFISLDEDNSLIRIYNLDTRKSAFYPLDMRKIDSAFKYGGFVLYPEDLFESGEIKNNVFKIKYQYKINENDNNLLEEIVIDINKLNFK